MIIAEVGSVHDGSLGNALKLADLARELGADAVKYQTHIADAESLSDAPSPGYFSSESRFDYFTRTGFSPAQWQQIKQHCDETGIEFVSSPFSEQAVEWLEALGVNRYKIPSGEVINLPLLERVRHTAKPVLLSSGMSNWAELDQAVGELAGADLTVLQCTSMYPCPSHRVGLNVLRDMAQRYRCPVGFSDHTRTNQAAFAAVAQGAVCIEKHLTFSRSMYGSDAPFAAEPAEFRALVDGVREISAMLASPVDKDDLHDFKEMKRVFQKSIVAVESIPKGARIDARMIGYKKPARGISAARFRSVIGKRTTRAIRPGEVLDPADIER